jgi:hypothetical protein
MAFPSDLGETYTTPNATDKLNNPSHTARHQAEANEIQALKEKVGIDSSADANSLDSKVNNIDHTAIYNVGTNTHAQIDTHIADTDIHLTISTIVDLMYPIGKLYFSLEATNPEDIWGVGTWVPYGEGKFFVGVDTGDADFDAPGDTGGEKTHLLTSAESGAPEHTHNLDDQTLDRVAGGASGLTSAGSYTIGVAHALANTPADAASAHNNLPPFIAVYCFRRTA